MGGEMHLTEQEEEHFPWCFSLRKSRLDIQTQKCLPRKKNWFNGFIWSLPYGMISSIFIIVWLDGALDYCLADCWCCVLLPPSKEISRMGLTLCQFIKHPHSFRNFSFIMLSYLGFCLNGALIRSIKKNNEWCLFEIWLSKYN